MTIMAIVLTYIMIWMIVFFITLPFGIKTVENAEEIAHGIDEGAPQKPRLVKKLLISLGVAAVLTYGYYLFITQML